MPSEKKLYLVLFFLLTVFVNFPFWWLPSLKDEEDESLGRTAILCYPADDVKQMQKFMWDMGREVQIGLCDMLANRSGQEQHPGYVKDYTEELFTKRVS